jgi:hypothetical protein
MAIVGCYTLDLYCDLDNPAHESAEFPHTFIAEHGHTCRRQAREAGWVLKPRQGKAYCPKCRTQPKPRRSHDPRQRHC